MHKVGSRPTGDDATRTNSALDRHFAFDPGSSRRTGNCRISGNAGGPSVHSDGPRWRPQTFAWPLATPDAAPALSVPRRQNGPPAASPCDGAPICIFRFRPIAGSGRGSGLILGSGLARAPAVVRAWPFGAMIAKSRNYPTKTMCPLQSQSISNYNKNPRIRLGSAAALSPRARRP